MTQQPQKRPAVTPTHQPGGGRPLPFGLHIIHEDRDILIVDKPAGLLTISTDREADRTAYAALMNHVRKGAAKSRNRIFIVHRLDRETSGLLLFAKSEEAKHRLQEQWDQTTKRYLAIIHGHLPQPEGTLTSYLIESDAARTVHSTRDESLGKFSQTAFRVLKETPRFTLIEVDLITGRKHQIRVHFSEVGNPIVGDEKYGPKDEWSKRTMALHSWSITFLHPHTAAPTTHTAPIPRFFSSIVGPHGLEKPQ